MPITRRHSTGSSTPPVIPGPRGADDAPAAGAAATPAEGYAEGDGAHLDAVAESFARGRSGDEVPAGPPRHPGLVANTVEGARPVDAALYGAIHSEAQQADWSGCGIEPLRYVEDRLDRDRFLAPLLTDPGARVVLHRRALSIAKAPGVDRRGLRRVSREPARDWPGQVYRQEGSSTFHIVAIPGEDWFLQTLHMLATAGVPDERILVEGAPEPRALAANDLDQTLAAHSFESVVVGTIGAVTRGVERALREREQPVHAARCLEQMRVFLAERAASARPDRRARWQDRARRLEAALDAGGDVAAQLARVEADPDLRSALSEQLRRLRDGAEVSELPLSWKNGKGKVFSHRVLEVDGKKHLVIHIGGAHGDLAHAAVARVLERQPGLGRVAVYGSCGSFDAQRLPPDTFVLPSGDLSSLEGGRPPLQLENHADLDGAVAVRHTNVSTLLREHRAGLAALAAAGDTVDIEAYHVARAVAEARAAGRDVQLRAILRVSDVANDPDLGAHRDDRDATSDYAGRREGEEEVVYALGLLHERRPTTGDPQ